MTRLLKIAFLRVETSTAHLLSQGDMAMMRQLLRRVLVLSTVVLASSGCETLHSFRRASDEDDSKTRKSLSDPTAPKSVDSDVSKLNSVDSDEKDPQPFFKRSRLSGGLSSEARDIEKDLGIY